jgi:hypothetical protein
VFWSKIWFFLVAVAAAAAAVATLVMPRPAEREAQVAERELLKRACTVTEILLRDNARARIQLAGEFARAAGMRIDDIAHRASRAGEIAAELTTEGRQALGRMLEQVEGTRPDLAILLDTRGRVVAQRGADGVTAGESLRGHALVDDALYGYLRDDLWVLDGTLYRVAASPIVTTRLEWAGAILLGHAVNKQLADRLAETLRVDIGFYVSGSAVATSNPVQLHGGVLERFAEMGGADEDAEASRDCDAHEPFVVTAGGTSFTALIARLPGEAGVLGGFYTVFVEHTESVGLFGMLSRVSRSDLSLSRFPWIPVGLGFLIIIAGGLALLAFEGDLPLRRLNGEAVQLAKGERERFDEDKHGGKYGSIARSVNIAVDKLKRDAKAARRDLDELLGPAPDAGHSGSLPIDPLGATGKITPPPPSEFAFNDARPNPPHAAPDPLGLAGPPASKPTGGAGAARPLPPVPSSPAGKKPARDNTPPPPIPPKGGAARAPAPPPKAPARSPAQAPAQSIDEDILGGGLAKTDRDDANAVFDETVTREASPFDEAATHVAEPLPEHLAASARDAAPATSAASAEERHFRQIFDEFLALKKSCGESTKNLTFEAFTDKLRSNRDALMAKHGCKSVRFQVYEKDGKAALKASPVK